MSREVELHKIISEATAAKAVAQAELVKLQAAAESEAETARNLVVSQAETLLALASEMSNRHQLGNFEVEAYGYGDSEYSSGLEWYAEGTHNWNASTC